VTLGKRTILKKINVKEQAKRYHHPSSKLLLLLLLLFFFFFLRKENKRKGKKNYHPIYIDNILDQSLH
jgi:hypothetical protein